MTDEKLIIDPNKPQLPPNAVMLSHLVLLANMVAGRVPPGPGRKAAVKLAKKILATLEQGQRDAASPIVRP